MPCVWPLVSQGQGGVLAACVNTASTWLSRGQVALAWLLGVRLDFLPPGYAFPCPGPTMSSFPLELAQPDSVAYNQELCLMEWPETEVWLDHPSPVKVASPRRAKCCPVSLNDAWAGSFVSSLVWFPSAPGLASGLKPLGHTTSAPRWSPEPLHT